MTYIPNPNEDIEVDEGGIKKIATGDVNVEQLLLEILKELKKLNVHMSQMSDLVVEDRDLNNN